MERTVLSVADCGEMPTDIVAEAARRDFDILVRTAIADATYWRTRASTSAWLRSPEMHSDWLDALLFTEGKLQVVVERLSYLGDSRAHANEIRLQRVRRALDEAKGVAHDYRLQPIDNHDRTHLDADLTAHKWLRRYYSEESGQIREALCAAAGLPCDNPQSYRGTDVLHGIEIAAADGLLATPLPPAAITLATDTPDDFRDAVSRDTKHQDARNPHLRHPLLLRRWKQALQELQEQTAPRAHAAAPNALGLLPLDLTTLDPSDAMNVLNNRQFYVALLQRLAEHERTLRQLHREVTRLERERKEPWFRIEAEVRAEIARRHPDEYVFVRRCLAPYGETFGSQALDPRWRKENPRWSMVRSEALAALADGSWRSAPLPHRPAADIATDNEVEARNAELRKLVAQGKLTPKQAKRRRADDNRRRAGQPAATDMPH